MQYLKTVKHFIVWCIEAGKNMALAEDQIMARYDQFMQSSSHLVDKAVKLGYMPRFTQNIARPTSHVRVNSSPPVVVLSDSSDDSSSEDEDFVKKPKFNTETKSTAEGQFKSKATSKVETMAKTKAKIWSLDLVEMLRRSRE